MFAIADLRVLQLLAMLLCGTTSLAQSPETDRPEKSRPETDRPETGLESDPIKKREPTQFLRVHADEFDQPLTLQTATVKYVLKDDHGQDRVEVFLESVVHIGDAAYYRGFNRRFPRYDAVLYELIAKPDDRIPVRGGGQPHPAKMIQDLFGDALGFKHQVDRVDYTAGNMVHSDLSPSEMLHARRDRGDDGLVILADLILDTLRNLPEVASEPAAPFDLSILSDPDGVIKLRRMMAEAIGDSDISANLLHPTLMRSLIDDRNERAMEVFQEQLDSRKRRIAFFWGAAHMPDFERRLILDYGFQREEVHWRNAWDLREGSVERAPLDTAIEKAARSFLDGALDELFDSARR